MEALDASRDRIDLHDLAALGATSVFGTGVHSPTLPAAKPLLYHVVNSRFVALIATIHRTEPASVLWVPQRNTRTGCRTPMVNSPLLSMSPRRRAGILDSNVPVMRLKSTPSSSETVVHPRWMSGRSASRGEGHHQRHRPANVNESINPKECQREVYVSPDAPRVFIFPRACSTPMPRTTQLCCTS